MDYSIIPLISYALGYLSSKMAEKEIKDKAGLFSKLIVVSTILISAITMRQYALFSLLLLISLFDFRLLSFVLPIYSIFLSHLVIVLVAISLIFVSTLSFIERRNYLFYVVLGSLMAWLI